MMSLDRLNASINESIKKSLDEYVPMFVQDSIEMFVDGVKDDYDEPTNKQILDDAYALVDYAIQEDEDIASDPDTMVGFYDTTFVKRYRDEHAIALFLAYSDAKGNNKIPNGHGLKFDNEEMIGFAQ